MSYFLVEYLERAHSRKTVVVIALNRAEAQDQIESPEDYFGDRVTEIADKPDGCEIDVVSVTHISAKKAKSLLPPKPETAYDALLDDHEEEAFLDCGCKLARAPYNRIILFTFCPAHRAINPVPSEELKQ